MRKFLFVFNIMIYAVITTLLFGIDESWARGGAIINNGVIGLFLLFCLFIYILFLSKQAKKIIAKGGSSSFMDIVLFLVLICPMLFALMHVIVLLLKAVR